MVNAVTCHCKEHWIMWKENEKKRIFAWTWLVDSSQQRFTAFTTSRKKILILLQSESLPCLKQNSWKTIFPMQWGCAHTSLINCLFFPGAHRKAILTRSFDPPENSAPPRPVVDCFCRPFVQSWSMGVMMSGTVHCIRPLACGGAGAVGTSLAPEDQQIR